jgi:uncharacterized protein YeaO (DUF488 family)
MAKTIKIQIKRVYDPPSNDDGLRILVDRLWPRGLKKADARIDFWAKELAPTTSLRKWFNHEIEKFSEFRLRYLEELTSKHDVARRMLDQAAGRTITLLFAARDRSYNQAIILQSFLSEDLA